MPLIKTCAVCPNHGAQNYLLHRTFTIPEFKRTASVNAGSIDLCDTCWNRLVNRRTLTLEGVERRIEQRRKSLLERYMEPTDGPDQPA